MRSFRPTLATGLALAALFAAALLAGCADSDSSDAARMVDESTQSGLGRGETPAPDPAPAAQQPNTAQPARYQWNGNPERVTEGAAAAHQKRPIVTPPQGDNRTATTAPPDAQVVEVRTGDTLHGIAQRHHVTVASLIQANRLTGAPLKVGQRLTLPPVAR